MNNDKYPLYQAMARIGSKVADLGVGSPRLSHLPREMLTALAQIGREYGHRLHRSNTERDVIARMASEGCFRHPALVGITLSHLRHAERSI